MHMAMQADQQTIQEQADQKAAQAQSVRMQTSNLILDNKKLTDQLSEVDMKIEALQYQRHMQQGYADEEHI